MKNIFDKTQIGSMTMKNRIIRSAIGDHGTTEDGHYAQSDFEGYEKVATGGVGTLITGYSWVSDYPMGGRGKMLGAYSDDFVQEYRLLTDMVHSHDCNIIQQLVHIGSATACKDVDIISASAVPGPYNEQMPREMTGEDIKHVTQAFADAAVRAKKAGFDGVEIHAAHKFLLSQFLSPAYNHRTDAYGASDENRARFAAEVCMRIRESVGAEYPVFFKVNCDDGVENGITLDGMLTACRMLEEAGASAIEISGAWMNYKQDGPYFLDQTIKAAEDVHIPVILVGGVRGKDEIEKILSETPISYVAMARPFIADAGYMKGWREEA